MRLVQAASAIRHKRFIVAPRLDPGGEHRVWTVLMFQAWLEDVSRDVPMSHDHVPQLSIA